MNPLSLAAALNASWMIQSPRGLALAVASPTHAEGLVTPIYTDRTVAEAMAQSQPDALSFSAHRLHDAWSTMRQVAEQGMSGFVLDDVQPLFFMRTGPESELPTHLAMPQASGWLILDEAGPTTLTQEDVQPWRDLTRFDRLSAAWLLGGDRLPFFGYEPDSPLFDYRPDSLPQPVPDSGLLLEAPNSALALFSSAFAAEWYWENVQGAPLTGEGEQAEQLATHRDIPALLHDLAAAFPDHALILNPGRHRFYQGFFRRADSNWYLATINGLWRVEPPFSLTLVARRTNG